MQRIESVSPEILLASLKYGSKVAQQQTVSWCVLWMCNGIERQDDQAQGDVLRSQQGIGEGLRGNGTSMTRQTSATVLPLALNCSAIHCFAEAFD
jgi:hypothetical protein